MGLNKKRKGGIERNPPEVGAPRMSREKLLIHPIPLDGHFQGETNTPSLVVTRRRPPISTTVPTTALCVLRRGTSAGKYRWSNRVQTDRAMPDTEAWGGRPNPTPEERESPPPHLGGDPTVPDPELRGRQLGAGDLVRRGLVGAGPSTGEAGGGAWMTGDVEPFDRRDCWPFVSDAFTDRTEGSVHQCLGGGSARSSPCLAAGPLDVGPMEDPHPPYRKHKNTPVSAKKNVSVPKIKIASPTTRMIRSRKAAV